MSSNIAVQRICQHCGNEFTAKKTVTRYCSSVCNNRAYKQSLRNNKIEASNKETLNIKIEPIEILKAKPYLSVFEASKLIGISKRSIYRLIERGELVIGKAGRRTIVKKTDLEQLLFEQPSTVTPEPTTPQYNEAQLDIAECYSTEQVRGKFGISESGLRLLIIKHKIPKIKKGWYAYVPKSIIDNLLS